MKDAYSVEPSYRSNESKGFWTQEARRHIFRTLLMKFGPYEQWNQDHAPTNQITNYEDCLEELARYFTAEFNRDITAGHGAVKQQIEYAIQKPVVVGKAEKELSKIIVLCKAAALEVGFIKNVWSKRIDNLSK